VDNELITLYWHVGHEILERRAEIGWDAKVVDHLAVDFRAEITKILRLFMRQSSLHEAFRGGFGPMRQSANGSLPD